MLHERFFSYDDLSMVFSSLDFIKSVS